MRLALIADIHGNLAALDAVLAAIRAAGIERIVCLGDVAATGPQPRDVIARLREIGCPVVMGNADWELLSPQPPPPPDTDAARWGDMDAWAAASLSNADRAFLAGFPATLTVPLPPDGALLAVHGSPCTFDDVVRGATPEAAIAPLLAGVPETVTLIAGGHTHEQMLRQLGSRRWLNPGSVGLAYAFGADGGVTVPAYAEYAVLSADDGGTVITFAHVAYDQGATLRAMFERGMPHAAWWSAAWARSGDAPGNERRGR